MAPTIGAMLILRLLTALLAPAGVIAAHALAYGVAHGWEHERQAMLTGHGPLAILASVALPLLFVALLVLAVTNPAAGRPRWRQLTSTQLVLYGAVELLERAVGVLPLAEILHDPAVWLAVAAQLGTAGLVLWVAGCTDRLVGRCLPPKLDISTLEIGDVWQPAGREPTVSTPVAHTIRRRGPPPTMAIPVRS